MGKQKLLALAAVAYLVLFGYRGLADIDGWYYSSYAILCAVRQILLGAFLFALGLTVRWSVSVRAGALVRLSVLAAVGLTALSYLLAFPWEWIGLIAGRLGVAAVIVHFWQPKCDPTARRRMDWLRTLGRFTLAFGLAFLVVQGGSYGFVPFHRLLIRLAHVATFRVAELLAWSSVLVIAGFARWLAERPDDRRRSAGYWAAVGACCVFGLAVHQSGVAWVLFGAGVAGALISQGSLSGRLRTQALVFQLICAAGIVAATGAVVGLCVPDVAERMRGFILSEENRYSLGYSYAELDRLVKQLSFDSEVPGFLSANKLLPDAYHGFFLVTVAAVWGLSSVLLFLVVSCVLFWLLLSGCRRIDNLPLRAVAGVLTTALLLQSVCGVLENAGWLPMANVVQPFTHLGLLPFGANAFFLGLLFQVIPPKAEAPVRHSVWPLVVAPLLCVAVGGGLYVWRQSESRLYRQEIRVRQEQLCTAAVQETEALLSEIQRAGELGENGVSGGVDRSSTLSRCMGGLIACLGQTGREDEAVQRMEEALDLVLSIQQDDSEVLADLLCYYAASLDRVGDFERSGRVYKEESDMRLRMKQDEVPDVVGRVVFIDRVCFGSEGYRKRLCWGDLVMSYDEVAVLSAKQLNNRMRYDTRKSIRGCTRLVAIRNGREENITVSLGELGTNMRNGWLYRDGHVEPIQE